MHSRKEMTLLKKLGLWVLGVVVVFSLLVWSVTPSNAAEVTLANAPTVDEWSSLVKREEGLTQEGCDRFFPQFAGMKICLVRWRAQETPERKLRLLQQEGHPISLQVFQLSRNHEYRNLIDGIAKKESLPDEAVREMKETTYGPPALEKCITTSKFGADQCVLMTGVLVPGETQEFQDPVAQLFLPDSGCSNIACRAVMHQMHGPRTYVNPNPAMPRAMARPLSDFGRRQLGNMRFPAKK